MDHQRNKKNYFREKFNVRAERMRDRVAQGDSLPQLTLIGLVTGIFAGAIIVLFRWAVEIPLGYWLPHSFENFEALRSGFHFVLPVLGACALGAVLQFFDTKYHSTGIGHVIDRLQNHHGRFPIGNFVTQFFGGIVCLLSGQSVGREGPAVHLGAGSGSLLGRWLKLPTNSLRPLAGCGVAAAIAACFNTPMAGVIFAMEVVVLEYSVTGFIPVILAAAAGAAITRSVFGTEVAFMNTHLAMANLRELPLMVLVGLAVAVFAAVYIRLHSICCRWSLNRPVLLRFAVAGIISGCCAFGFPQIMGIGYDTIGSAMAGEMGLALLLSIAVIKVLATSVSLGVGMPGGVVGPLLFIGACVGGAVGMCAQILMPESASGIGLYVILGMGAMMGATLNAPLAAMMAILELTYNPNIIFPSMLAVIAACLITRGLFRCDGLFQTVLQVQGKFRKEPISDQLLARIGVRSVMDRNLVETDSVITKERVRAFLTDSIRWIFLRDSQKLFAASDLQDYLDQLSQASTDPINLSGITAESFDYTRISADANLSEALELLEKYTRDTLIVESTSNKHFALGVIHREDIKRYYYLKPN